MVVQANTSGEDDAGASVGAYKIKLLKKLREWTSGDNAMIWFL